MEPKRFAELQQAILNGSTLSLQFRKQQLSKLLRYLRDHEKGLIEAMVADFMIPHGAQLELNQTIYKLEEALSSIDQWIRPTKLKTGFSLMNIFDTATIHYDPKGVVLIIGAWNAPLALIVEPLIGAISAGCCAVIKPSELATNTSDFLEQTLPLYLDPSTFDIVIGGAKETEALIKSHAWDLIFYTGSQRIGKLVYEMAATRLIPVVLELGGKSPVIVLNNSDDKLQLAADRIVWGKLLKGGQICVAPDYLLVDDSVFDKFVGFLINSINKMFGTGKCDDIDLIVNSRHWHRLNILLEDCGGKIVYEGVRSKEDRYFGPIIVTEPSRNAALMTEEIFGPILPVLRVRGIDEAIEFVNQRSKPLILYMFCEDQKKIEKVKALTRYLVDGLPFGGVGASGIGGYHGRFSFETFSHPKACLERGLNMGFLDRMTRFPPYTVGKVGRLNWVMFRAPRLLKGLTYIFLFAFFLAIGSGSLCWYWNRGSNKT